MGLFFNGLQRVVQRFAVFSAKERTMNSPFLHGKQGKTVRTPVRGFFWLLETHTEGHAEVRALDLDKGSEAGNGMTWAQWVESLFVSAKKCGYRNRQVKKYMNYYICTYE